MRGFATRDQLARKYYRDYQAFHLEGDSVAPGRTVNFTITADDDFLIKSLCCEVFQYTGGGETGDFAPVDKPHLTATLKVNGTALDNSPVPVSNAWGVGERPARLHAPLPVRKGQIITVEANNLEASGNVYWPFFTLIGDKPTKNRFEQIVQETAERYVRPYQTYTLVPVVGSGIVAGDSYPATTLPTEFKVDFPTNFLARDLNAVEFDSSAGGSGFLRSLFVKWASRNFNFVDTEVPALAVMGSAQYPGRVHPGLLMAGGDILKASVKNYNPGLSVIPYITFVGCIPSKKEFGRLLFERNRSSVDLGLPTLATE